MDLPLSELHLRIADEQRTFYYRSESPGDQGVITQALINCDYDFLRFKQGEKLKSYFLWLVQSGKTPLVIDAGANIGATVAYFAGLLHGSRIVAIEPEKKNCHVLRRNCAGLDFTLLEGGIGSEDGKRYLHDPGEGDWGFRVQDQGEYEVPVFGARDLVGSQIRQGLTPFIFKIDIEGGEDELFSKNSEWVSLFPLVMIELHDWLFPGEGNSRNFLRVISSLNFDFVYRGETAFCFNNDLLARISPNGTMF